MELVKHGDGWALVGELTAADGPRVDRLLAGLAPGAAELVLYLSELTNVSSSALKLWMEMKRALALKGIGLALSECSSSFIDLANIYDEILRDTRVTSAYLPVECVKCNAHDECLVPAAGIVSGSLSLPRCTSCADELAPLIETEEFFECLCKPEVRVSETA